MRTTMGALAVVLLTGDVLAQEPETKLRAVAALAGYGGRASRVAARADS